MKIFGKTKEKEKKTDAPEEGAEETPQEEKEESKAEDSKPAGSASVEADLIRIKAQVDSFSELRKVFGERFSRTNEMIGELRGMIIETNKDLQQIQLKSAKAVDLVEAVQPDKLMTDMRKQDVKTEVLKANIESNEARMDTILKELKDIRGQLNSFRGIEEIVKLSEEVKDELIKIRKVKSTAERHSDKIESIFIDFQKRVRELTELEGKVNDNLSNIEKVMKDFDSMKVKIIEKADKKEVEKLITTSKEFEDHTTRAISLLNRVFVDFEESFIKKFDKKFERVEKLEKVMEDLTKDSPNIEKNLASLEEMMRKKIEEEIKEKQKKEKKKSLLGFFKKSEEGEEKAEEEGEGEDEDIDFEDEE